VSETTSYPLAYRTRGCRARALIGHVFPLARGANSFWNLGACMRVGSRYNGLFRSGREVPLRNPYHAVLVTDLDNTLYDFAAYYEAGLAALVDELCFLLSMEEDAVTSSLREVFAHHGSIEYPFAVEEIPEVLALEDGIRNDVIRRCMSAFWSSASDRIEPYPTVRQTLRHLQRDGVTVIAHTDAPIHEVMRRLRHMNLDRYFTGIIAQQWFRRRPGRSQMVCLSEVPGWSRPPRRMQPLWRIPVADRKPSASVYRRIAQELGVHPGESTVIGDSVARDLLPAVEVGFTARAPESFGLARVREVRVL
jgi:FMN phosphatase YigB (HAD superfamily)